MKRDNMNKFFEIDNLSNTMDATHTTSRDCPLCGSIRYRTVLEMKKFQFFSDSTVEGKQVDIRDCQCLDCLTLYRNPSFTPSGFNVLFAEAGCSYGSTEQRPQEQIDWLNARQLLMPGSVFLDVGCYEGSFLSKLPSNVIRMGVDIDAPAIARGRARDPEINLTHAAFDAFTPEKPPEVISLFHVLEHLPDPLAVLRRLRAISAQKAKLVVEVPVLDGGETNDINGFFSVQHLTHFSRNTLHHILKKAGWDIIEVVKMKGYNGYRVLAQAGQETHDVTKDISDIRDLQTILSGWYKAQAEVERPLTMVPTVGNIVIWGAGLHTEVLYHLSSLFRQPERRFLLVDSDPMKQGKSWRGIPIVSPDMLNSLDSKHLHLVVSSYGGQMSIEEGALERGVPANHIHKLYESISVY